MLSNRQIPREIVWRALCTFCPRHPSFAIAACRYANEVQKTVDHSTPGNVAAFMAETIQGVGGTVELPPGYLAEAYRITREAGGLCIADEVQTGFGRTGEHFWGFETQGVTPDIVTMGKLTWRGGVAGQS